MKKFEELNTEQKLLMLLSRLTFSPSEESELFELAIKGIDWYVSLYCAVKNKVLGFVYFNLDKYDLVDQLPKQIIRLIRFYYTGNKFRNEVYIQEIQRLSQKFDATDISYAPLKRISLLTDLYKHMPGRSLNDIDCMIDKELIPRAQNGRPPKGNRLMFNAMLWMARSGAGWEDLPKRYGPWETVYSRFCKWRDDGTLCTIFLALNSEADLETLSHSFHQHQSTPAQCRC